MTDEITGEERLAQLRADAARLSLHELTGRIEAARGRLTTAARELSEAEFEAQGRSSLQTATGSIVKEAQQVLYVALSGELPPEAEASALPGDMATLVSTLKESLNSLYAHMDDVDPEAFLDSTWRHPVFGELNWREWLLAVESTAADCAAELEQLHAS